MAIDAGKGGKVKSLPRGPCLLRETAFWAFEYFSLLFTDVRATGLTVLFHVGDERGESADPLLRHALLKVDTGLVVFIATFQDNFPVENRTWSPIAVLLTG